MTNPETIARTRRHGRQLAREIGVPCVALATLKRRARTAAFRRWGLPNGAGPQIFGVAASLYVDDEADGAPRLVVIP